MKSCYSFISKGREFLGLWKDVCNVGIPLKVQFFMRTTVSEKLSTMDMLRRKGFYLPNICLLCHHDAEPLSHLLLHCPYSWDIWCGMARKFGVVHCSYSLLLKVCFVSSICGECRLLVHLERGSGG